MNKEAIIKLFPKSLIKEQLPFFDEAFAFAQLNTPERIAMFLAQTGHETQRFTRVRENLNYSAQGMANTWPKIFSVDWTKKDKIPNALAKSLHRQPEEIANHAYAFKNGNGSVKTGEGWKFRGGGDMMTTGIANYRYADKDLGLGGQLITNPELLEGPHLAVMSAASYWKRFKLNNFADKKNIRGARRIINGGLIGLKDVVDLYDQILTRAL